MLVTPGEEPIWGALDAGRGYSFLSTTTMPGAYAEALGAALVVVERGLFRPHSLIVAEQPA